MKTVNKENITNWEIGDCFVTPIKSQRFPQYNDRYLIIICCDYYEFTGRKKNYPLVYYKISKKEVNSEKDIDDAEFYIRDLIHMGLRYLPYSGLIDYRELEKERDKVKLYPDEYGFLKEYRINIFPNKNNKEFIRNCKYIKYENFERPKEEFFHWQDGLKNYFQGDILTVEWFFDKLMYWYQINNERKLVYYHFPLEEMQQYRDKSLYPLIVKYKDFMDEYCKKEDYPRLK